MTLETELLLSIADNYYYSIITPLLSHVPVCLRFVIEAFDIIQT